MAHTYGTPSTLGAVLNRNGNRKTLERATAQKRAWFASGSLLLVGLGFTGAMPAQAHPAQSAGNACPPNMEVTCGTQGSGEGDGIPVLTATCACGDGSWVRSEPEFSGSLYPPTPQINQIVKANGTSWVLSSIASVEPGKAHAHVSGRGSSHFWRAGSMTRSAGAQYTCVVQETWHGNGVPCPRVVELAASGGGGLSLSLTCSAAPGCGASGTGSISGTCSSLGRARAHLDNKRVDGSVAFNSLSTTMDVRGNFGVEYDDNSASVQGRAQRSVVWSLSGSGNVSGSATYSVRPECTYCAFTNRAVTRRANGVAVCSGGATVDDNGSASFDTQAIVTFAVN